MGRPYGIFFLDILYSQSYTHKHIRSDDLSRHYLQLNGEPALQAERSVLTARPALPDLVHTSGGIFIFQPTSSAVRMFLFILSTATFMSPVANTRFLMPRIIIFANGDIPNLQKASALIKQDDFIICADGGTRHALSLNLTPHIIIGDMDSLPSNFKLSTFNGEVILYPKDKNETDLELAINHAITLNPNEIIIIGALGGRIDHTFANISLLANPRPATCDLRLNNGQEEISLCKDQLQVKGRSGDVVSLIPYQGNVEGVTTQNLKWKLTNETLYFNKTRGISNEMISDTATISITKGLLLVVHQLNTED